MGLGRIATAALLSLLVGVPAAQAAGQRYAIPLPVGPHVLPAGYRVDSSEAVRVADQSPAVRRERAKGPLRARVSKVAPNWQVSYFRGRTEVARASVGGRRPRLLGRVWTGPYVLYPAARGTVTPFLIRRTWAYALLTLVFIGAFLRRRRRAGLRHLDLLAIVAVAGDELLFSYGHIYWSVPLLYPPLLYLVGRCVTAAFGRGTAPQLESWLSERALAVATVALVAARAAATLVWGVAGDVGYASMFGADSIVHGWTLYTVHPAHLDTYGPVNYLVYAPFEWLWPLGPNWAPERLVGARVVAILADLVAIALLTVLGRQARRGRAGRRLGLMLGFAWAACPLTFLPLFGASNDAVVADFILAALVSLRTPALRGAFAGLGAATKFAPLGLLPLLARGPELSRRAAATTLAAAAAAFVVPFLPYVRQSGLATVWNATAGYQLGRSSPFVLWGLHPSLLWVHPLLEALAVALVLGSFWWPRGRRAPAQVAAACAAILIASALATNVWWHSYADWFAGPLLLAVLAGGVPAAAAADAPDDDPARPLAAVAT